MKVYVFEYINGSSSHGMLIAAESPRKALNLIKKEIEAYGDDPGSLDAKISLEDIHEIDVSVPIVHSLFHDEIEIKTPDFD